MPQRSNDRDERVASPIPQDQDDELEMADDEEDFEDDDELDDDDIEATDDVEEE
jgi:hypothetical protein